MEQIASDISACPTQDGQAATPKVLSSQKHPTSPTRKNPRSSRIPFEQKKLVLKWLAEFHPPADITYRLKKDHGVTVTEAAISFYNNSPTWRPTIEKLRQTYVSKMSDVPSYHKTMRLRRVDEIYQKTFQKEQYSTAIHATEHARKEVEGDKGGGDTYNAIQIQFNSMSDEEIENRKKQVLKYLQQSQPQIIDGGVVHG